MTLSPCILNSRQPPSGLQQADWSVHKHRQSRESQSSEILIIFHLHIPLADAFIQRGVRQAIHHKDANKLGMHDIIGPIMGLNVNIEVLILLKGRVPGTNMAPVPM